MCRRHSGPMPACYLPRPWPATGARGTRVCRARLSAMEMPDVFGAIAEAVDWVTAPSWTWLRRLASCVEAVQPCLGGAASWAARHLRAQADHEFDRARVRADAVAAAAFARERARIADYGIPAMEAAPRLGGLVGALVARFQTSPELVVTSHASRDGWAAAWCFAGRSPGDPWPCGNLRTGLAERIRRHLDARGPALWLRGPGILRAPLAAAGRN